MLENDEQESNDPDEMISDQELDDRKKEN